MLAAGQWLAVMGVPLLDSLMGEVRLQEMKIQSAKEGDAVSIAIEIEDQDIETRKGTAKDGREFTIRSQVGFIDLGGRYPQEFRLTLMEDQGAYAKGRYLLEASSLYVGRYCQWRLKTAHKWRLKIAHSLMPISVEK